MDLARGDFVVWLAIGRFELAQWRDLARAGFCLLCAIVLFVALFPSAVPESVLSVLLRLCPSYVYVLGFSCIYVFFCILVIW